MGLLLYALLFVLFICAIGAVSDAIERMKGRK